MNAFKRFCAIAGAVAVGFLLAQVVSRHAGAPSWWPDRERDRNVRYYRDVAQMVHEEYYDGSKAGYDDLTRAALKGMVGQLDPHSEFMTADEYSEAEEELTNEFSGVGIEVEQRDNKVVVITPIAGTPAERAGIRRGDQLVKVDGQVLENPTLDKSVKLLRGKPDTEVVLTMFRPAANKELDFKLKRQKILLHSVRNTAIRSDGIGYLQITQFSEHTGEEFAQALEQLEKQGMKALIIDLRNNPGGLLDAAIDVCGEFFDRGELVVYTQGRTADSRQDYRADGKHPHRSYPIAVIVNGGTASAAEIVTGAMKDTKRAVIVGERSFGKGSVQSVIDLQNGEGMHLTTARYFTPSGVTIHEHGVAPQVEVEMSADDESKLRLQESRTDVADPAEFADHFGFKPIEDLQLDAASEVLSGLLALRAPAAAH
ncbi:MAG TPA: S41 family peptidase [Candidatus Didemnitutus sp.]|nr:S41 family peptidase [Candidatus Didemnitutus sp.]